MKVFITAFFIAYSLICSCAQGSTLSDNQDLEQKVDALVKSYEDLDIFSGVVLIAEKGEPVYHKAFGLADRSTGRKNTLETTFDIGSMNKAFTKIALLKLVKQGKLSLADTLGKFIDGFPENIGNKVTVRNLLTHTSGFGDYHGPAYFDLPYEEKRIANLVELFKKHQLMFEPGTEQAYSNTGYILLGAIIEKVTGQSYFDVVEDLIVKKLGMKHIYLAGKKQAPDPAIGYLKTMRGELESNEDFQDPPNPDGGFYATAADILKFYRAYHYGNKLWTNDIKALDPMFSFIQEHQNSGGAISHAGGFNGANTVHYEILRDQISVVVFANMDEPVAENLGAGILAIIRGKEPKPPTLPAIQRVYKAFKEKGGEYIKAHFDDLSTNFHPTDPHDIILNNIGYNLLYSGDNSEIDEAIAIFTLNTELFPDVANVWDSLGEAYRKKGDLEQAKKAYQHALKLAPGLETAERALQEMN